MITLEKMLFLKSTALFQSIKAEALLLVASALEEVVVEKGRTLIHKGEFGRELYIIVKGRVKVHDGDLDLKELGEREVFGELAALMPDQRNASVTTLEDSLLLKLSHLLLFDLMETNFGLVKGMIDIMVTRLRETDQFLIDRKLS